MRIFLYEFVTGGGLADEATAPSGSLLDEGRAMVAGLAADLAQLTDTRVEVLRDRRLDALHPNACRIHVVESAAAERQRLQELSAECDATILIAPESDGVLAQRVDLAERSGGRLASPSADIVRLAADKQAMAQWLDERGVPVTTGIAIEAGSELPVNFSYPAVLKPRDGAGSVGIRSVAGPTPLVSAKGKSRLERRHEGIAASIAALCGPAEQVALMPCRQHLSEDGCYSYLGGSFTLSPPLRERAASLARRAIAALPNRPVGYLGVDLILGPSGESDDVVVEINPRLTTSYVGLRAIARENLAEAMLQIAAGQPADIQFEETPLRFSANRV